MKSVMKNLILYVLISMTCLLAGCTSYDTDNRLGKVLYILNMSGNDIVYNYPFSTDKEKSLPMDSVLDKINIWRLAGTRCSYRIVFPFVGVYLDSLCNNEQLVAFTDRRYVPAIRICSFISLLRRKDPHIEEILLRSYKDTTKINVRYDDVIESDHVGNLLLTYVQESYRYGVISKVDYLRNDSLAFFTREINDYQYVRGLLEKHVPEEKYYERAKQMYLSDHNYCALQYIAKFHKAEDKRLIKVALETYKDKGSNVDYDLLEETLSAVSYWSDKSFVPILTAIRDRSLGGHLDPTYRCEKNLFVAVMAYDNAWAFQFINTTLSSVKDKYQAVEWKEAFFGAMLEDDHNSRYQQLEDEYPY